ncbi:MAG TPA: TIGR02302 family protein [Pseudolabrys sp.]|nr:TIGR02302 family protein [Pseudolabrys sp.]
MDGIDDRHPENTSFRLLKQALQRARGSILWERLWPALATLAVVIGLFLAVSWAGLWQQLPPLGRPIGLFIFALLVLAALIPLVRLRLPSTDDALRRLDRGSGAAHRPATAMADAIAANEHDPVSQALWRAHVERAILAARSLKAGWPAPRLAARDPQALRALVLILVLVTFFAASGERWKRIGAAFDWQGIAAPANFRVDAWVTPPPYTQRAPVMLPGLRPGELAQLPGPVSVPAGSQLIVRATGKVKLALATRGGLEDAAPEARPQALPAGTEEHRFIVKQDGSVTLRGVGEDVTWTFNAIPDRAPTIALTKDPEVQARGSLLLAYSMEDDYGVTDAHAVFERKADGESDKARPLYGPPQFPLVLPQARTRSGTAQTLRDVTDHPWAGAEVTMTLVAHDEAGNEGRSEPFDLRLPQRAFVKPLARALVEQRQILAMDANAKIPVLKALDALSIAPERFTPEAGVYLGLRSIYWQLTHARTDDALRDVVAALWTMALSIENGNVSDAEQALRQAEENLRQALDRGASDEEIKKLMDQLRAAMDKFMQALAEEMRKNPQQAQRPLDRNTRMLSQQDLKNMMDRLENMARLGNKDAARRLLEQLQQMMENLQMARPGQMDNGDDDMMSQLDELGDMIRKQQQLRDRTFRQGQDMRRDRQRGQRGQNNDQQMGELRQDQQALRERLKKMLEELRKRGAGDPQQGEKGEGQGDIDQQLGDAGDAMGRAEDQLGDSNTDGAVDSQGKALESLRKGAQGMAQQLQQQQGVGLGPGQPGRNGQARADSDTDPLGRPRRGHNYDDSTVKIPGRGEAPAERASRILEELRRRYSDQGRPQLELDYLERLLKDF